MINITNANSTTRLHQICFFHKMCMALTSGRLAHFPDVMISKRPNFLPCYFVGELGRSGRSGRLSRVSCIGVNTCVFFHICRCV